MPTVGSVPWPQRHYSTTNAQTVSSAGSALGTGGMSTKIIAARLGTSAGVTTIITKSSKPGNVLSIVRYIQSLKRLTSVSPAFEGDGHDDETLAHSTASLNLATPISPIQCPAAPPLHTRFLPSSDPIRDRQFWLLHTVNPHGTLYIDGGAHKALLNKAGLLPVGVVDVEGNFAQHEAVRLVVIERRSSPGPNDKLWEGVPLEVGRALVNYAASEISRIKGHQSIDIRGLLGYADSEYVADRHHVGFFRRESRPVSPTRELSHSILPSESNLS